MLDEKLLDQVLSDQLEFLKFACTAGSVSANQVPCKLFEAHANRAWVKVGSTTVSHPNGVTAEMLSKIWSIDHAMAARTLKMTTQLNRIDENFDLVRNF